MKRFSSWLKRNNLWFEDQPPVVVGATDVPQQTDLKTTVHQPIVAVKNTQQSDNGLINSAIHLIRTQIDATTWDYGKDSIETAFDSITFLLPLSKKECDQLKKDWIFFKNALYGMQENWWGQPNNGPPNKVLHDTALMRIKDIDFVVGELNYLFKKYQESNVKNLFLTFYKNYSRVMPQLVSNIKYLRPQ